MSAVQALADIQNILVKYRISATVVTWYEDGRAITKITVKNSKPPPVFSKKRKNPSRMLRDKKRRTAYAAKMAGSCEKDPGAAPVQPAPSEEKTPRWRATPLRRLDPGSEKEEVRWRPEVEGGGNPDNIPQLDGCGKKEVSIDEGGGEDDEDDSSAAEEEMEGNDEEKRDDHNHDRASALPEPPLQTTMDDLMKKMEEFQERLDDFHGASDDLHNIF